jgi:hypothetical protein
MKIGYSSVKIVLIRLYKNTLLTKFLRNIRIKTFYQLEFMGKLINLQETSMDRVDTIVVDFPIVERYLEGVMKVFLQFDNEYLIIPMESMLIYGSG